MTDSLSSYFALAKDLGAGIFSETALADKTAVLLPLNEAAFNQLARHAVDTSFAYPKQGWAITAVLEAATNHWVIQNNSRQNRLFQARAAWEVARAANSWTRLERLETAVWRAEQLFTALDESGWLAACRWQQVATPWLHSHFPSTVTQLENALQALEKERFTELIPHCRLSLASAYMLVQAYPLAQQQLDAAKPFFYADPEDAQRQWQHAIVVANLRRREANKEKAEAAIAYAASLEELLTAPAASGYTNFVAAYIALTLESNFSKAENLFEAAAQCFEKTDLSLLEAQAHNGLIQCHNYRGALAAAHRQLQKARQIFERENIKGLWSDNLLDSGRLEITCGRYRQSLIYFAQALQLAQETENEELQAVIQMNQGEAYLFLGRYQQSLYALEAAYRALQRLNLPQRLAQCAARLANAWLHIGEHQQARIYLDELISFSQQTEQVYYLSTAYYLLGVILFQENKLTAAFSALESSLELAVTLEIRPEQGIIQRLMADIAVAQGKQRDAAARLKRAEALFDELAMPLEKAACSLVWGRFYAAQGESMAAREAWKTAVLQSQDVLLDVQWQALAELGRLAESENRLLEALSYYQQLLQTLKQLRQGIWQPSITNTLLRKPARALERAIHLSLQLGKPTQAAVFVEESKAQTNLHHGAEANKHFNSALPETLNSLILDIRATQEKMRTFTMGSFIATLNNGTERQNQQLAHKIRQYDSELAKWERQHHQTSLTPLVDFELSAFQAAANKRLGQNWVALNYYATAKMVYCIVVTPEGTRIRKRPLLPPISYALQECRKVRQDLTRLTPNILKTLGTFLIPRDIQQQLQADTTLIIVPHRYLHQVPWSVLTVADNVPLIAKATPLVTPSLHSLHNLWVRQPNVKTSSSNRRGFVLGMSSFANNRYPPLPFVGEEIQAIKTQISQQSVVWQDKDNSWHALKQLAKQTQLDQFAFWHVASHAQADTISGRFSRLALYNDDILTDWLWELAPLPKLVMLSACNSIQNVLCEGNEAIGLAMTCLAAGAQHVVGSLWPVLDKDVTQLTADFYNNYFAGAKPSVALAQAQRQAWLDGRKMDSWGGFACLGS